MVVANGLSLKRARAPDGNTEVIEHLRDLLGVIALNRQTTRQADLQHLNPYTLGSGFRQHKKPGIVCALPDSVKICQYLFLCSYEQWLVRLHIVTSPNALVDALPAELHARAREFITLRDRALPSPEDLRPLNGKQWKLCAKAAVRARSVDEWLRARGDGEQWATPAKAEKRLTKALHTLRGLAEAMKQRDELPA